MLIFDLGCLHITSDTQDALSLDINTATQEQLESAFYDKFNVRLENLQALVASPGQDWAKARVQKDDLRLHLIKPTGNETEYYAMHYLLILNDISARLSFIYILTIMNNIKGIDLYYFETACKLFNAFWKYFVVIYKLI